MAEWSEFRHSIGEFRSKPWYRPFPPADSYPLSPDFTEENFDAWSVALGLSIRWYHKIWAWWIYSVRKVHLSVDLNQWVTQSSKEARRKIVLGNRLSYPASQFLIRFWDNLYKN